MAKDLNLKDLKDRKLMKWSPFFMAEHKDLLKKVESDLLKVEKPVLDEYKISDMNDVIVASIQDQVEVKLSLWKDGFIDSLEPVVVTKIDPVFRKMHVNYKKEQLKIPFDSLVDVVII